ncbi:uncharacterized protein I303_103856 [Kwoniella dejecticola CBS 10117]|uniref:ATP-dependent DNA helicase II subunit 2 n=1 Tax=Kwoniella dejecticola CBS 10117 TaxID=1296121 RepID=A0A1A6A7X2_9TREE|nr:uncharacterized protein I303_03875 [Kwoniella dejecticola CBS 10117]OBR86155.1 hypothetical protein I303_03875 [Kwoniella dejecticola CBS 10117]
MPSDRAGYTLSVYAIDVSPPMGEAKADPGGERKVPKLNLVKEYVARKCEPKISSGRKTEAVGILSYGGKTNNQANQAFVKQDPDNEDPPYSNVSCDVAIQTAKPKTLEVVMNLNVGAHEGNPVSALMVALDMIHIHKHTKSWALEVVLITDGESAFRQDEYEDAMDRFDDLGVRLSVVGIDFQPLDEAVDKTKTKNKRLSEKFWRTFVSMLHERISKTTNSEEMLPTLETFDEALIESRLPRPAVVNGTVSGIDLHIGSPDVDAEQAITIPIKYSKATMKARPPTLSKAWKPAMDLQLPARPSLGTHRSSNQLMSSLINQSQSQGEGIPKMEDFASLISAEVKHHSTYVVKKAENPPPPGSQMASQAYEPTQQPIDAEEDVDEEFVEKEDLVKAWRFGSTWVPMEADTFEPMETKKGVEILGFFPKDAIKRHLLMGEVRFVWPDLTSPKGQIQFSALVEGMELRGMCAVVRWVLKDQAEPVIGLCLPAMDFPGEGKRLDYMYWVKLPFAEDEHNFWFPSLTTYKTATGKVVKEHPLIPTDEQCELMDDLVGSMDLDEYAKRQAKRDEDDVDMSEEGNGDAENESPKWFDPQKSYNPVIHRIKEAIFHASLTSDLDADPLGPPHPELTKYFNAPSDIAEQVTDVTRRLKEALDIKKVAPKTRKKIQKEGLREDEGYIDIDELFDESGTQVKAESSTAAKSDKPKIERPSPIKGTDNPRFIESDDEDMQSPAPTNTRSAQEPGISNKGKPKPKAGRLISNETPLEDFKRLIEGEGDIFRKALQDLGAVVEENIQSSFSYQNYPTAIECLKEMRATALMYEEVETYNEYVKELEKKVKSGKKKDFWERFEGEGKEVAAITEEEAQQALEEYD